MLQCSGGCQFFVAVAHTLSVVVALTMITALHSQWSFTYCPLQVVYSDNLVLLFSERPSVAYCCLVLLYFCGDSVVLMIGQQTFNLEVTGLSSGWAPLHSGLGQATYTCVHRRNHHGDRSPQLLRPWDHRWIGPSQLLGPVHQCNVHIIGGKWIHSDAYLPLISSRVAASARMAWP